MITQYEDSIISITINSISPVISKTIQTGDTISINYTYNFKQTGTINMLAFGIGDLELYLSSIGNVSPNDPKINYNYTTSTSGTSVDMAISINTDDFNYEKLNLLLIYGIDNNYQGYIFEDVFFYAKSTPLNINNSTVGLGRMGSGDAENPQLDFGEDWIIENLYPVGSIHITTDSTNPSAYFGGTWERFANGQVLVCVNTSDTDFATVNKTGGAKTHTITTAQMPSHRHQHTEQSSAIEKSGKVDRPNNYASGQTTMSSNYGYAHSSTSAHNNLQPYITCYMWLRTA